MTAADQFRWTSAARSHIGLVRDINEDACLERPERGLWAVADGMGGHALGDFASRLVIDALDKLPATGNLTDFATAAGANLQAANRQLRMEAAMRAVPIIGSTVVALFARDRRCRYLWAGDSRLYLYRNGHLSLLSRDHSQVEELKARGSLSAEEAIDHPARNLLTRAVGATDLLDLDEVAVEVDDGDMFLLCSDGLSNEVSDSEICAALVAGDCRQASEVLIDMALKHGGRDNISAVVVRADDLHSADSTVVNPAVL